MSARIEARPSSKSTLVPVKTPRERSVSYTLQSLCEQTRTHARMHTYRRFSYHRVDVAFFLRSSPPPLSLHAFLQTGNFQRDIPLHQLSLYQTLTNAGLDHTEMPRYIYVLHSSQPFLRYWLSLVDQADPLPPAFSRLLCLKVRNTIALRQWKHHGQLSE